MTEPIILADRRQQRMSGRGERTFLCCPCSEDAAYVPVIQHDAAGWFITSLVCMSCETETTLINGRAMLP